MVAENVGRVHVVRTVYEAVRNPPIAGLEPGERSIR